MRIYNKKVTCKMLFACFATGLLLLLSVNQEAFSQPLRLPGQLIFIDTFESGQLEDRWILTNSNSFKFSYNPQNVRSGKRSMEVTALPGKEAGDLARIFFPRSYDKVHARWYCKFDSNFDQGNLMHLNRLIASKGKWTATAGTRPNGFDFFRTGLDVWRNWGRNPPPGEPVFYSYFPVMKIDQKTGKYYGNMFKPETRVLIERGQWYCMEMMLKANDPGADNGEQAFWINGALIGHFKNIIWRFTSDLKINSFQIGLYIHDNEKINQIWYDDIIISTGFIGM
jgi:hypothetical protein